MHIIQVWPSDKRSSARQVPSTECPVRRRRCVVHGVAGQCFQSNERINVAMPGRISAHFLPSLVAADELVGAVAVVIDLLRASTTICHALAAGATEVIPCLEVDQARKIAAKLAATQAVLGGEREGVRIEGFDLG